MKQTSYIPYSWPLIAGQIRRNVIVMADILRTYGPSNSKPLLDLFLGCDSSLISAFDLSDDDISTLDVSKHAIYQLVKRAYDYAYQLEGAELASSEDWHEVVGLLVGGYPQTDRQGEPAPLYEHSDEPLRRVLETFFARWALNNEGFGLSVRQLALLANMTVQAVRNSLSKEGFKLELQTNGTDDASSYFLPIAESIVWLTRRRGFIPNRPDLGVDNSSIAAATILRDEEIPFPDALTRLMRISGRTVDELHQATKMDRRWVEDILAGKSFEINVKALQSAAVLLGADPAKFAGRAVEYLVRATSA